MDHLSYKVEGNKRPAIDHHQIAPHNSARAAMQISRHHDGMARGRKSIYMRFPDLPLQAALCSFQINSKIVIDW
jgi:hypothetical protein